MIAREEHLVIRGMSARFLGCRFPCRIGRGGVAADKREGDGATPIGVHRAESVLFRPDRVRPPRTSLPLRPIRRQDGWSDDPDDPAYNALVRRPHNFGSEALWLPSRVYDVVCILDWNRDPILHGRGSAIFLHLMDPLERPTAGCVALRRSDLLFVLENWRAGSCVVVE